MSKEVYKNRKRGLGRGLESLFSENMGFEAREKDTLKNTLGPSYEDIPLSKIKPDLKQPRKTFSDPSLEQLSESLKTKGVLQPLLVSKQKDGFYKIIAGERRYRAAQKAGLEKVPVVVRTPSSDKETLEWALVENLQREDLNILEEAKAYKRLIESFHMTQQEVALAVSKERSTVANVLRLLQLPESVQAYLSSEELSLGHAKVLLSCSSKKTQQDLARKAVRQNLSVKALKKLVDSQTFVKKKKVLPKENVFLKPIQKELERKFQTTVKMDYHQGKGKILFEFYSNEQFSQILDELRKT